jgi:hypothetical protein
MVSPQEGYIRTAKWTRSDQTLFRGPAVRWLPPDVLHPDDFVLQTGITQHGNELSVFLVAVTTKAAGRSGLSLLTS